MFGEGRSCKCRAVVQDDVFKLNHAYTPAGRYYKSCVELMVKHLVASKVNVGALTPFSKEVEVLMKESKRKPVPQSALTKKALQGPTKASKRKAVTFAPEDVQ